MSHGDSDHPRENPLRAFCEVFAVRAAEVALGQDKVQSGVPRQKLVESLAQGQGREAGLQTQTEQGSGLVRVAHGAQQGPK